MHAKIFVLLFTLAACLGFAVASGEVSIPAGAAIQLRLTNEVSS